MLFGIECTVFFLLIFASPWLQERHTELDCISTLDGLNSQSVQLFQVAKSPT